MSRLAVVASGIATVAALGAGIAWLASHDGAPSAAEQWPLFGQYCIDCHNRPTHSFPLPERAVDEAITAGRIGRQLPFVKKKAVELLRAQYPDRESARRAGTEAGRKQPAGRQPLPAR